MIPDFRICDKCKTARVPRLCTMFVALERVPDGAGSSEDSGLNVDLCHSCALAALTYLLHVGSRPNYELGKQFATFMQAKYRFNTLEAAKTAEDKK